MTERKKEIAERLQREFEKCENEIAHDYPLMENDVVGIMNELYYRRWGLFEAFIVD